MKITLDGLKISAVVTGGASLLYVVGPLVLSTSMMIGRSYVRVWNGGDMFELPEWQQREANVAAAKAMADIAEQKARLHAIWDADKSAIVATPATEAKP